MILGWQIFWFSLKQVFGNFFSVVKISTPMLFMSVILFIELQMDISGDEVILVGVAFAAFYIFASLWTIVSLHRFLLISEHPVGLFPVLHFDRMLAYLGRSLIVLLVVVPISMFGLSLPEFFEGGSILLFVFPLAAGLLGLWVSFRICLILPASAVGKNMSLREAWLATKPISSVILVVSLLFLIARMLVGFFEFTASSAAGLAWVLVAGSLENWILLVVGVSVVSTFYAYLVEKRELT